MRRAVAWLLGALVCAAPSAASAFCGFYVSGADTKLYNNATTVALMRDGTRTVLSMQNNYQGPPADFAMVVPVPVVLKKDQVKTLPREVFDKLDQLAAPRLVEYWEQDPCNPNVGVVFAGSTVAESIVVLDSSRGIRKSRGVKVEAKFAVGEYEILILSANDSSGLDLWLRERGYKIPDGAAKVLRPYVSAGMKFFVAKVNVEKVSFENGMVKLSPLRFYYDSEQFNLPVRLGLMNSRGKQDLIVHVLARAQRYEAANYKNVTIPTNLDVAEAAKESFGSFYAALFDATLEAHPRAVVTEYAWDAGTCDPCPGPTLDMTDLATLGADVVAYPGQAGFVITRLHARYAKGDLGEDLVFRAAPPIVGGREFVVKDGKLERGARLDPTNNFQGRYIIRHEWKGEIACENPKRGVWGGPPDRGGGRQPSVEAAKDTAFAKRDMPLASFVDDDIEEIDFHLSDADPNTKFRPSGIQHGSGCAGCAATGGAGAGAFLLALVCLVALRRKRQA